MKRKLLNIIGIPLVTFSLFVFECSDPQYYLQELIWSFFISLALWEGNGFINRQLNGYIPWRQPVAPRIFIQIGISVIFTAWITYFAVKYLYAGVYEAHFSSLVFRKNLFVFLIISLLYNAISTGTHFFKQWRKSIVEAEELKRQNLMSQYETLKNQINPHFLFNSINTLIGLIDEDPELAKNYGLHFSKVYRYILDKGNEELISLKEELEIVEIQKQLFESRFGKGLVFIINIKEELGNKLLPPLTLQMLIENAIKHNTVSVKSPLTIKINSQGNNTIVVENNIQVKNVKEVTTQVGIENIKKRYQFLTKREVIIRDSNNNFVVEIPLLDKKEM